jgi:type I restriction enzyme M protein
MNLMLHGIYGPVSCADTLSPAGQTLGMADLVLTNPPFNKMTGVVNRPDFSITAAERIGPSPFLEHVVRALKPGGRAAVVMPDNALFGNGTGAALRAWLLDECDLHTMLRLPSGIFYAQGINTNVLFFNRRENKRADTRKVWIYDLRTNIPAFGKTRPLSAADFSNFEKAYGNDPKGKARRRDQGPQGRFRSFTREDISERNGTLDISWLRDEMGDTEAQMTRPEDIASAILLHLRSALGEVEALSEELEVRAPEDPA